MPFVFTHNPDSSYAPAAGLEDAILTELDNNPDVHHTTTLVMALAGGWASNPPTVGEFDQVREKLNEFRDIDQHDPRVVTARFVETDEYVSNILSPGGLTMAEVQTGWQLAYDSQDARLPDGVTPEDRSLNVPDIKADVDSA